MTISVRGERYNIMKEGVGPIGDIAVEDDNLSIIVEEAMSVEDLKELLDVAKRIEKENDL